MTQSRILFTVDIAWKRIKNIIKDTTVEKVIVLSVKSKMPKYMQVAYNVTKENKIEKPVYNESIINWKTFIKNGKEYNKNTYVARTGDDEAVILYSGGTSGTPKGIRLSNSNFNAEALTAFHAANCLKPGDKVLAIMPIFHGFGLGVCVHTILANGGQSILLPQFSAKEFHKLIKKYKPNAVFATGGYVGVGVSDAQKESPDGTVISKNKSVVLKRKKFLKVLLRHKRNIIG